MGLSFLCISVHATYFAFKVSLSCCGYSLGTHIHQLYIFTVPDTEHCFFQSHCQRLANEKKSHRLGNKVKLSLRRAAEASRVVRHRGFHMFKTVDSQMAVMLSALRSWRLLPPGIFMVLISVKSWVPPQSHSATWIIRSVEKSSDVGNRTRNLPACSIIPQPTTVPHAPKER
jgi:hypothetical protein